MPRDIILVPEAVMDIRHAYQWYEEQQSGLGEDFLGCLEKAFDDIATHPGHYPT